MRSERVGGKIKQLTLLNLGRHFEMAQTQWPTLCTRIEELLSGQVTLMPMPCPATVERQARRITAQLVARGKQRCANRAPQSAPAGDVQSVDAYRGL